MRENWQTDTLDRVCKIQTGKYDANHANPDGIYRFFTCAYDHLQCNTARFTGPAIILPGNGANVGEVFFYKGLFDAYQRTYVLNKISIHPKLLYYHLKLYWKSRNIDKQYGSATNYVRMGNFLDYEITYPPLPEQRSIVAKIEQLFSELDNGITNLKTAQEQLKVYRQAVLKKAFDGKLTKEWRAKQTNLPTTEELLEQIKQEREKHYQQQLEEWKKAAKQWEAKSQEGRKPGKPKPLQKTEPILKSDKSRYGNLTHRTRLGAYISDIAAGKSFRCVERPPASDEVGVAKVSAVTWGDYEEKESKTCLDIKKVNPAYFISKGDFLISRANTIDLVGACVIAQQVTMRVMLSDKTLRIHFSNGNKRFFLYYLRSLYGREEIQKKSTGNQESMRNIGQERIRSIIVPLFSKDEQDQIVQEIESRLSVCDKIEESITESLAKAEALRQSILKKAFEGKLLTEAELAACRKEPVWEPAEKLLERVHL